MTDKELTVIELTEESIESMVYEIRGQKVMLDFDLARIYGYTTKAFNQQVQRNIEKFPEDFMFQLTLDEIEQISRSQIAALPIGASVVNNKSPFSVIPRPFLVSYSSFEIYSFLV